MNPDRDLHDTTIDVEHYTGASMAIHKRVQVNIPLESTPQIDILRNVRPNLFPIFWLDEGADLDEKNSKKYHKMLTTPLNAVKVFPVS